MRPSVEYLRAQLRYDPVTGELWWLQPRRGRHLNRPAGCKRIADYTDIKLDGKYYRAHRVIWAIVTGKWPEFEVDHKNRRRGDNRWANLREATSAQNKINGSMRIDNSSGCRGVSWHALRKKWRVRLHIDGCERHFGLFGTKREAIRVFRRAASEHYGEFAHTSD